MTFYRYFFPLELTKIADYTKRAEPAEPTRCKSPALRQTLTSKRYNTTAITHRQKLYIVKISAKWKKTRIIKLEFFFSPVIAWLNEVATVAHSNPKDTNNTSRRFGQKISELLPEN